MQQPFLLTRLLLRFGYESEDLHGELSSVTVTPDGSLWVGSDEFQTIERLSPVEPYIYGDHKAFHVGDFTQIFSDDGEIDIEGLDFHDGYLWITGSHSVKRKKPKDKKAPKALERLATIKLELNRYTLVRIPIVGGEPLREYTAPEQPDRILRAGTLRLGDEENALVEALRDDEHLAPFMHIPNKENGFDVEGLAVRGDRVFLGLRGPVLRGWAVILELHVTEREPGVLGLEPIGSGGQLYRKHFVELNGMGIRELCILDDDMIILAGPTMDLEGAMEIFRLHDVLDLEENSITSQASDDLEGIFYLPFTLGTDHAEGLALLPALGQPHGLLVVYDSPDPVRVQAADAVFADVFSIGNLA
jgi:hypothetical protein